MGFFSKIKKKLKKLKLKNIGKDLAKGIESVADIAKNLPAPVGTIGKVASKGFDLADKIKDKADGISKKLGIPSNALESLTKKSSRSSRSSSRTSSSSNINRQSERESRREERRIKRLAKTKARRDGYKAYN